MRSLFFSMATIKMIIHRHRGLPVSHFGGPAWREYQVPGQANKTNPEFWSFHAFYMDFNCHQIIPEQPKTAIKIFKKL